MSRIYNRLKSLETQITREKIEREQNSQHAIQDEPLLQIATECDQPERQAHTKKRSIVTGRTYKGYFAVAFLLIGGGGAIVAASRFYGVGNVAASSVTQRVVNITVPVARPIQDMPAPPAQVAATATATPPPVKAETGIAMPRIKAAAAAYDIRSQLTPGHQHSAEQIASIANDEVDAPVTENAGAGDMLWESRSNAVREQLKAEAYSEASKSAQQLALNFPGRWEPWFWLGTAQLAQGQMDAAEAALDHAGKLDANVAQVWVQRAIVAQERGDHAAAVRLLAEAQHLSPMSPQIYLNLGYSNDALHLPAEAEKNYRHFLSLTEGDASYSMQRQHVIKRLGNFHPGHFTPFSSNGRS